MQITSAYANTLLKNLQDEKDFLIAKEAVSSMYTAAANELPVIPDYDFQEVEARIAEIDEKMCAIKHAVNLNNATATLMVGDRAMTIDAILIKLAQLNGRKSILDSMRKQLPKKRLERQSYTAGKLVPEYRFANYDLELARKEYDRISQEIMTLQMCLDRFTQTVKFEVDI